MVDSKRQILKRVRNIIGGILALGLLASGIMVFAIPRHAEIFSPHRGADSAPISVQKSDLIVDGVLDTDEVDISSKLPGRLAEVAANEGDTVRAGQVVAVLQAEELDAKQEQATAGVRGAQEQVQQGEIAVGLEQNKANDQIRQARAGVTAAEAALGMARAKLAALEKGARPQEIEQAAQAVEAAQAVYDTAGKTYQRIKSLADEGVIARQKADEAEMAFRGAQAQLAAARAKLSLVKAGARDEEILAAREQVRQADAGVEAARGALQLAEDGKTMVAVRQKDVDAARQKVAAGQGSVHEVAAYQRQTRITSPISGRVTQRMSRGGEIIAPGYAILTVARTDSYWVDLYVDESKFAGRRVGDRVAVEIPAAGKTISGRISKVLAAGDFATKRANNEKGTFDVRSVQLRVTLDQDVQDLASGLTARVHFAANGGH